MELFSKSHVVLPNGVGLDQGGCIYINPIDEAEKCFRFDFTAKTFIVNAADQKEAGDILIDWFEDNLPEYLFKENEMCLLFSITKIEHPYVLVNMTKSEIWANSDSFGDEIIMFKQKIEIQSLMDLHEYELTTLPKGRVDIPYLMSVATMPTGNIPYQYYAAWFYDSSGAPIMDRHFYRWMLKHVF